MFYRYNFFGFLWSAIIFVLSVVPGKDLPKTDIIDFDFLCHVFFYMVLVFLFIIGFIKQYDYRFVRYHPVVLAFSGCMFYGILIEIIQHFFCDGRFFDFKDILANFIGAIFGVTLFKVIYYKCLTN